MADKAEKDLDQVDVAALLRCLDGNEHSKVITPEMFLKTSGVIHVKGIIIAGTDFNDIIDTGVYNYYIEIGSVVNGPGFTRMLLLCINSSSHVAQVAFSVEVGYPGISYRGSWNNGASWNEWKSISIT